MNSTTYCTHGGTTFSPKRICSLPGSNRRPCACEAHVITATLRKPWCYPVREIPPSIVTIVPQTWHPAYFYCPYERALPRLPRFRESNPLDVFGWRFEIFETDRGLFIGGFLRLRWRYCSARRKLSAFHKPLTFRIFYISNLC